MISQTSRIGILLTLAAILSGCGMTEIKPFDPVAMQRPYREAAANNVTPVLGHMPTALDKTNLLPLQGPADQNKPEPLPTYDQTIGPVVRMSLRDLVQLAAANSLQVRVANYQAAIDQARVIEAEARFDPSFFSNFNFATQYSLTPSPQNTQARPATKQFFETTTLEAGFKQNLPNGAQVQLKYSATRTFFRDDLGLASTTPTTPFFESDLSLQVTQPLLQNAGVEVNEARIVVARNTQRVSMLDARIQLEKTLGEVEDAYWQLVQAETELQIQQDLYNQSVDTAQTLRRRLNQDVSRDTIAQANSSLQARKAGLVEARNKLKGLSNALKRRVNDPSLNSASAPVILPEDKFIDSPIAFDLVEQIETGLMNRAELAQQRIRIDSATVVYKAAQNNLLPSLNLVGSIGTKGADKLFGSALNNQFIDFSAREYAIGFQFEVPLGNREARAIKQRTMFQRQQAIDQYQDLIEQVCQEVKDAHDTVYDGWERMRSTRQSLYAAEEWLAAIVQQQDVGGKVLDPDFINRKLAAQEGVAQARREFARAEADYNVGISTLEKAKGTLLKYDNVIMKQEPVFSMSVRHRTQE